MLEPGDHVGARGSCWSQGVMLEPGGHVGARGSCWSQGVTLDASLFMLYNISTK